MSVEVYIFRNKIIYFYRMSRTFNVSIAINKTLVFAPLRSAAVACIDGLVIPFIHHSCCGSISKDFRSTVEAVNKYVNQS